MEYKDIFEEKGPLGDESVVREDPDSSITLAVRVVDVE